MADEPQINPPKRLKTLFDGQMNVEEVMLPTRSVETVQIAAIGFDFDNDTLQADQKLHLKNLLQSHENVFVSNGQPANEIEHKIDTAGKGPVAVSPYRLSAAREEMLRKEINKMVADKLIEPFSTPWAANAVLVPKAYGGITVSVDYRDLNSITVPDTYSVSRKDDVQPAPFMSSLNLKAEIKIREEDREKTGLITPFGIYVFNRMPFDLRNSHTTFQRLVDKLLNSLEDVKVLAHLDDLIVLSSSFEAHLTDLGKVLEKIADFNIIVNLEKSKFCCQKIKYMGHYITPKGLGIDPEVKTAISDLLPPTNLRHLIPFLHACSSYRHYIPNYSEFVEPLTRLLKSGSDWVWTSEQQQAYDELKNKLINVPILRPPQPTKPYVIKTQARGYALGAVLAQGEGQEEYVVAYASRLLNAIERNYSRIEKDALAMVWAVKKFKDYIHFVPTVIQTDNQDLKWLMSLKSPVGRLARWALQLQAFEISIHPQSDYVVNMLCQPQCTEETKPFCDVCIIKRETPARSRSDISKDQLKDKFIANIVEAFETDNNDNASHWSNKGYFLDNGLLYRVVSDSKSDEAQLLVPESEWANTVAIYHDNLPPSGHCGAEKIHAWISKRYFWRGMKRYIEAYVKNCPVCKSYKPPIPTNDLSKTTVMEKRFETVIFDLMGPLPVSYDGKKWILIIEDFATGWIELFALADAVPETCANTLINEIFFRYGVPKKMTSDNCDQYTSFVMQKLCYCLNIDQETESVLDPVLHPVQRKTKDLKEKLQNLVDNTSDWPDRLPMIRFAFNTASITHNSSSSNQKLRNPAFLVFGKDLRAPYNDVHQFRQTVLAERFIPEFTPKLLQMADGLQRAIGEIHVPEVQRQIFFN